jgi:hypothetical protein
MVATMRVGLLGAMLVSLLCCGSASAAYSPQPTVAEAHEFLASTFARYRIGYVVWYGPGLTDNYKGHAAYYGGADCVSELGADRASRAFAVDWSLVAGIDPSGAEAIYVRGQLMRTAQYAQHDYANFHLYFPDPRVARRVAVALELVRRSCRRQSQFD